MKILVADKISPKGVAYLRAQPGFDVVEAYGSSPAKVLELVKDVHAIAVRSETKITAEVIAAAPLLKVVGRAGVGVDNVDVDAATERGVIVMNTPSGNTIATAERTFAHILCGGKVAAGTLLTEQAYLDLEFEAFLSLCGEEKSLDRIKHMLEHNKPLRN